MLLVACQIIVSGISLLNHVYLDFPLDVFVISKGDLFLGQNCVSLSRPSCYDIRRSFYPMVGKNEQEWLLSNTLTLTCYYLWGIKLKPTFYVLAQFNAHKLNAFLVPISWRSVRHVAYEKYVISPNLMRVVLRPLLGSKVGAY